MKHRGFRSGLLLAVIALANGMASGARAAEKELSPVFMAVTGSVQVSQVTTGDCQGSVVFDSSQFIRGAAIILQVCTNDPTGPINPTCLVMQASLRTTQSASDWMGFHNGYFRMSCAGQTVGLGTMTGVNGTKSCDQLRGTMRGVLQRGSSYASFQADYEGELTDVACPSSGIPAGSVQLTIRGVQSINGCPGCD